MKCLNTKCNANEIEKDDNFCYLCGHWTAKGYTFMKEKQNYDIIQKGNVAKQNSHLVILVCLLSLLFGILTLVFLSGRQDLFRVVSYIKKQAFSHLYGYQTTLINTNTQYSNIRVQNYDEAISLIKNDFSVQNYNCFNSYNVQFIENTIEKDYDIPAISFCDMSIEESEKIKQVIDKMYHLFPNIKGALTNITITNTEKKSEYIARFQPMYQFVNVDKDINNYNRVNKTQILLNSYYFLNKNMLTKNIEEVTGENWYVKDATWESTIAHEMGHYISFLTLLKKYSLEEITFVTKDNYKLIDAIVNEFNEGTYSKELVLEALNNYQNKYQVQIDEENFANSISLYAGFKNQKNEIVYDETIAEAIHDYYLHEDAICPESKEIIEILITRL